MITVSLIRWVVRRSVIGDSISRRQDDDTRNEHQDDDVTHTGHVRMARQEGFRIEAKGSRRMRKGHLQEGEREPVRMVGGSGRPGRFGMKQTRQEDVCRMHWLTDDQAFGLQEKLSRMSREHEL